MKKTGILISALIYLSLTVFQAHSQEEVQYISSIIEYTPAPGQFINIAPGLPQNAQTITGDINGLVTLGFFGGTIVVGFDKPIPNHPDNPYGVDFTVFGNPTPGSSEPGIVMVMKDKNENGLPDDTWYELQGSDHHLSSSLKNYQITYTNPGNSSEVPWSDNQGNTGVVNINSFHTQQYYPSAKFFPHINQATYTLSGTLLKHKTYKALTWVNSVFDYGYADNRPMVFGQPHNLPDNPYTLNVQEGCGGDAFDISWAVDENDQPVEIDQIDFVKIYTGVAVNAGAIGEISTEIRGIAAVKPDASITGPTDVIVSNHPPFLTQISTERQYEWPLGKLFTFEACVLSMGHPNEEQTIRWTSSDPDVATINASGVLTGHKTGKVEITAAWELNNDINRSYTINITPSTSTKDSPKNLPIRLYPNPAHNEIWINGAPKATLNIFNAAGVLVMTEALIPGKNRLNITHLHKGLYLVRIKTGDKITLTKFFKQ